MRKSRIDNYNKKLKIIKIIEIVLIIFLILFFGIFAYWIYISFKTDNIILDIGESQVWASTEVVEENNNIKNFENVNKATVGVSKIKKNGDTIFLLNSNSSLGIGTGFIISEDGYIVTNEHIAGNIGENCYITTINGIIYDGEVVWSDSELDISIIKINKEKLDYVSMGDSDKLELVQNVYTIGNSTGLNFKNIITSGIISGLNKTIKSEKDNLSIYLENVIQTDAVINDENTGGPLVNSEGEVIGITTNIYSTNQIGYVIPINTIKPILEQLKNNSNYKEATLGLFAYDKEMVSFFMKENSLTKSYEKGIYVADLKENSPAYKSGIKVGDIIYQVDNVELNKMSELRKYIYQKEPGDIMTLKYLRNYRENEVEIKLEKK